MAVLRFLGSEIFSANECLTHFIVAAADPKHRSVGEGRGEGKGGREGGRRGGWGREGVRDEGKSVLLSSPILQCV